MRRQAWLGVGMALLGVGCSDPEPAAPEVVVRVVPEPTPISVAVVGPLTGPLTEYGDMLMSGAVAAVERHALSGELDGHRLRPILLDDGCDAQLAETVARQVVQDGIRLVVGHLCSEAALAAAAIYDRADVLMLTPAATHPRVTEMGYTKLFRTIGRDDRQGAVAAQYLLRKLRPQRLALVEDAGAYGAGLARVLRTQLAEAELEPRLEMRVRRGQQDFSDVVNQLRKARIDLVYFAGYYPEMGHLLRQARKAGFKGRFMGGDGIATPLLAKSAGRSVQGVLVTMPDDFRHHPRNHAWVAQLRQQGKETNGPHLYTAYAAMEILIQVLNQVGEVDVAELVGRLRGQTFNSAIGPVRFDAQGDIRGMNFRLYEWQADGSKQRLDWSPVDAVSEKAPSR